MQWKQWSHSGKSRIFPMGLLCVIDKPFLLYVCSVAGGFLWRARVVFKPGALQVIFLSMLLFVHPLRMDLSVV